jgi:hypothetical protein
MSLDLEQHEFARNKENVGQDEALSPQDKQEMMINLF